MDKDKLLVELVSNIQENFEDFLDWESISQHQYLSEDYHE